MNLLRRLTAILVTCVVGVSILMIATRPLFFVNLVGQDIGVFMGLMIGLTLMALVVGMMHIGASHSLPSRLRFLPFPFILVSSVFVTISYLENPIWMWSIGLLTLALVWLWYESLYMFWQQPELYQPYTLQRLSVPLYVLALFFFTTAIHGLYVYLQMRFLGVMVIALIIMVTLFWDVYALCQLERVKARVSTVAGTILAIEAFIAISYLPTQMFMQALLMGLTFYALVGITRLWAQDDLRRAQLLPYILVSSFGFLITLGSSLWIV